MSDRKEFFIDSVHLNDVGMDRVARLYAGTILATDMPDKFDKPHWLAPISPFAPGEIPVPDQIRVSEATYGMNCKDFKVPPFAVNSVRSRNATEAVADVCGRKLGSCQYTIDAAKIGDPANSCAKDFSVSWSCGAERKASQSVC